MLWVFEHDILGWVDFKLAEALTVCLLSFFFLKFNQLLKAAVSKNFIRFCLLCLGVWSIIIVGYVLYIDLMISRTAATIDRVRVTLTILLTIIAVTI